MNCCVTLFFCVACVSISTRFVIIQYLKPISRVSLWTLLNPTASCQCLLTTPNHIPYGTQSHPIFALSTSLSPLNNRSIYFPRPIPFTWTYVNPAEKEISRFQTTGIRQNTAKKSCGLDHLVSCWTCSNSSWPVFCYSISPWRGIVIVRQIKRKPSNDTSIDISRLWIYINGSQFIETAEDTGLYCVIKSVMVA